MRLAVTRRKERLTSLIEQAELQKVSVVPLPLLEYLPVSFDLPAELNVADIDWLFFTSAKGVSSFFGRIDKLGLTLNENTKIGVVGKKTAKAVSDLGLNVAFIPSQNYGRTMFEEFAKTQSDNKCMILYARGEQVNFDPADMFKGTDIKYNSVICYRAVPGKISPEQVDDLDADDYLLFTAPSTVTAYNERFGQPQAKPIAIGRTTESEMIKYGWHAFAVMSEADIDKVWEYM